ncbi:MAG: hypothetical protein AB1585_03165 [Thermodesulfobacteriota bacterium]
MKTIVKIGWTLCLILGLCSCHLDSTDSAGDASREDYRFLYDYNAKELDGYTIRWESNTVKVYTGNISGAESFINRWQGPVNFQYVNYIPSDGVSFSYTPSMQYCGVTYYTYNNAGRMIQARVEISTNQFFCKGGLENTVTHEMGHALGFLGHTSDGSLMDPDGGNGNITTRLRNFMSLLYRMPYGTNIKPYLSFALHSPAERYQKDGQQIIERVIY